MAAYNKKATLAKAKLEFGSLPEAALNLYWCALQHSNRVCLGDLKAPGVKELVEAKMATTKGTAGNFRLVLTKKAIDWAVPADKESRVSAAV